MGRTYGVIMTEGNEDFDHLFRKISSRLEKQRKPHKITPYVVNGIAIVVTLVWAASFVADVSLETYNPPGQIHMIMMGIVGSLFGFQIMNRNGDG